MNYNRDSNWMEIASISFNCRMYLVLARKDMRKWSQVAPGQVKIGN